MRFDTVTKSHANRNVRQLYDIQVSNYLNVKSSVHSTRYALFIHLLHSIIIFSEY